MKRTAPIALLAAALIALAACSAGDPAPDAAPSASAAVEDESAYHKIDAATAKEMMDGGDVTVVDVRRQDEYDAKHIPGAVLVPNESIGHSDPEALPDKEAKLIVYCRTGVRSKAASDKLVELGYENVYDMGGINDWPYDTEP